MSQHTHLLSSLQLPSRYESLSSTIGSEVIKLLVQPEASTMEALQQAALHIKARRRGLFLPIFANSGTGKTTLVSNLHSWLPSDYAGTGRMAGGTVTADRLKQTAQALSQEFGLPANDSRIRVLNIDDRESDPPTDQELAQIKGFLRESEIGHRCLIVWPETSKFIAETMARDYEQRAGHSPVEIPVVVGGPPRDAWAGIAIETLKLANGLEHLEDLGVDPRAYPADGFDTLGDFLDRVSSDFVDLLRDLINATKRPLQLITVFASESAQAGILTEFLGSSRYGLLDAERLLSATRNSVIGKWWSPRVGSLIQAIFRLDARVVFIGPSLSIPIARRFGPDAVVKALETMDVSSKAPSDISHYFERADFGKLLLGTAKPTGENRGNPAVDAVAAYQLLSTEVGFNSGQDKKLNGAIADFLSTSQEHLGSVQYEKKLDFVPLIPDIAIAADEKTICLELHWRSGDFLVNANRSEVAQYVLGKLKSYAVALEWIQG